MSFPRKTIPIALKKSIPTPLTVAGLKKQLTAIGLTCPASHESKLETYVAEFNTQLPNGIVESYAILKPASLGNVALAGLATNLTTSSTGNWEPDSTGLGYGTELEYLQYGLHFDWLKANRPEFTGIEDNPPQYEGTYDTVDAIKKMFLNVGTDASATLIKGVDKAAIQSVLSNAIAPLTDANASVYNVSDSRVIFLVENYNPLTQNADAVGVLTIEWTLKINDYKEKKKIPQHKSTLTVKSRSVLYSSIEAMNADFMAAKTHFKENSFALAAIPVKPTKVVIFDALPVANNDTFLKSLPTLSKTDVLEVIVLYSPDLQNVGSIDNTNSDTVTSYSQSLTSGFTFSSSQSFSVGASFEVSIEVVKIGFTMGFSISFNEEWSKSRTETMSFEVPAGKKAFTYQGYLMSRILRYDAKTDTYSYDKETAKFITNILSTSRTPLVAVT